MCRRTPPKMSRWRSQCVARRNGRGVHAVAVDFQIVADEAAGGIGEVTADAHIPEDSASRGVEAGDPGGPRVHRNADLIGVDLPPAAGAQTLTPRAVERQPSGVECLGAEGLYDIPLQPQPGTSADRR